MFQDGFGRRVAAVDGESGDQVEILTFAPALLENAGFAEAVGERVARLARVRHRSYARARRLERPSADSLALFSDRVEGWRLAEMLDFVEREQFSLDISSVLALLRQLIPAVTLFSRHQRDATIGSIGPERLILTPQGRLVVTEYVMAPGLEKLQWSRERLWHDLRVAVPASASPNRLPPSVDVVGIGVVAMSLLLGRLLKDDEYLVSLAPLCQSLSETHDGKRVPLSGGLSQWLLRALHVNEQHRFQTSHEAQVAFEAMLAKERNYVTAPAQLDAFIARFERAAVAARQPVANVPLSSSPQTAAQTPSAPTRTAAEPSVPPAELPALSQGSASSSTPTLEKTGATSTPASVRTAKPTITLVDDADRPALLDFAPESEPSDASEPPAAEAPTPIAPRQWSRWLIAAAALIVVQGAAIAWLLSRPTANTDKAGELTVQTRPVAARVTIDGEERGVTPLSADLAPGPHILEVRVGRSEPRVIPVLIRPGMQSGIYVELQSVATVGGLDVRSDPAQARVSVNGQFRGMTPLALKDLAPGDHEVLLEAQGQNVRQRVHIEPGVTSQLVVPLRQ